ncbi:Predicted membrane protein (DUF2214) [Seminavis robusta]|uniref:Predicted membrane protein (DUF2214) n=1 Tax=Seminavis robusta TaxID=568900 RepID=A0A9N8DD34_9STRA|nr:Predicted membrane protein (DUF2214) [Seminavis robusta]|eukprot:Sro64_g036280.1 Predicted membrane protein (DUF2214) (266) ;mRNA; r:68433-69230
MPPVDNPSLEAQSFDPFHLGTVEQDDDRSSIGMDPRTFWISSAVAMAALLDHPADASAAVAGAPNAVPSALAAFGHYFSILGMVACVTTERLTIQPGMSQKDEEFMNVVDVAFGALGVLTAYTGYLRVVSYDKGWEFYSHEPIFWLKIVFLGVFGASSFFNTTTLLKRAFARQGTGTFEPIGEALANRMIQICNAELTALAIIPLTATFMARGIGYSADIPWEAGAALSALVFGGLSFKYIKEALQFEDTAPVAVAVAPSVEKED